MPFHPIDLSYFANFLQQQQQQRDNPAPDLNARFKSGFELAQMPGMMRQQRESNELANALSREKLAQLQNPEIDELGERLREAQAAHLEAQTNQIQNPRIDQFKQAFQEAQLKKLQQEIANAETPEQKRAAEFEYDKKKADLKAQTEKSELTGGTISANQKLIQAVDSTLPAIGRLRELKIGRSIGLFSDSSTDADQQIKTATESMMSALNLPSTDSGIKVIKGMLERNFNESAKHYDERLKGLENDLIERRQRAEKTLKAGKLYDGTKDAKEILKNNGVGKEKVAEVFGEPEEKKQEKKILKLNGAPKGFALFSVDGVKYTIPENEINDFIKAME